MLKISIAINNKHKSQCAFGLDNLHAVFSVVRISPSNRLAGKKPLAINSQATEKQSIPENENEQHERC
jgi:hypothetical protein